MKLYIMKKKCLEVLKSNIKAQEIYSKYGTQSNNEWLKEVCAEDPFEEFKDIAEFKLHIEKDNVGKIIKGKTDFENCKIIYRNLKFLSESQASDERLWAGLCHSIFYDYVRQRWEYDTGKRFPSNSSVIKLRFFLEGREGIFSNTLARYWWTAHLLYDVAKKNPFEKLDILGAEDMSSKFFHIFNRPFVYNRKILNGVIRCFEYFKAKGIKLNNVKEQVAPAMQKLNAIGGALILDCLSEDEIARILILSVSDTLHGKKSSIVFDDSLGLFEDEEIIDNQNYLEVMK